MLDFDAALRTLVACNGSDLHLKAGTVPRARIHGELLALDGGQWPVLKAPELEELLSDLLAGSRRLAEFETRHEIDFSRELEGVARFRINARRQRGGIALVARAIPHEIRTIEELALPAVVATLADELRGIVLLEDALAAASSPHDFKLMLEAQGRRGTTMADVVAA